MSKQQKRLDRLASLPKDFEWDELSVLLKGLGFTEVHGSGARVSFHDPNDRSRVLKYHVPHGRSPKTVYSHYLKATLDYLRDWGFYD